MIFERALAQAREMAKPFEGYARRLPSGDCTTYLCPANVLTIGYGSTGRHVKPGMVISEPQAAALLEAEMRGSVARAISNSPNLSGDAARAAAIADFIFNCGSTAYAASTLRKRVNAGDWTRAAAEIKRWNKGGGRVLAGLVARRQAEANLLTK